MATDNQKIHKQHDKKFYLKLLTQNTWEVTPKKIKVPKDK